MSVVAVTGASGFIGRSLIEVLHAGGHEVVALSRNPGSGRLSKDVETRRFDPNDEAPNPAAFEGTDAVVNLAGESIAGRWTPAKKRAIYASRVDGTRHMVASLRACARQPRVLVSASAIGYYGSQGEAVLEESSPPGDDFLARLCVDWEAAANEASGLGIRTVRLRFGLVLGAGGALAMMKIPFLAGLGGPLGSGRQYVSWVHVDDLASLCVFAIDRSAIAGPVNAVAPSAVTNAEFSRTLGAVLHRPSFLPVPAFVLRSMLGEFAETLLASQRVVPAAAQAFGFAWLHPNLKGALSQALAKPLSPRQARRSY